jgi:transposase
MAIADGHGLPIAIWVGSASPHEVTLVDQTLDARFVEQQPQRLIGDKAYDSDGLDDRLRRRRQIELIAPHRRVRNRKRPVTQDGRQLRRYCRRWKIERLFAWLHHFRRVVTRWDYYPEIYLGFVHLACMVILLRNF